MSAWTAHTGYQASIGMPLPDGPFRSEDLSLPRLGDLIVPGTLVRTNYGTGPYLVDRVSLRAGPHGECWLLSGLEAHDGIANGDEHSRGWLNEYVAVWSGDEVRFLHLFPNNRDELRIVGSGFRSNCTGQLAMFA